MSYEIYKSIKQNEDGSFEVISASSNCRPLYFNKWHMDYFNKEFPDLSNSEKRAAWLLYSLYVGDRFYVSSWKQAQVKVESFCEQFYGSYDSVMNWFYNDKSNYCEVCKHFAKYLSEDSKQNPKRNYVVYFAGYGQYCMKKTSRRVQVCVDQKYAKVFHDSVQNLSELFGGYARYNPQFIEV